MLLEDVTEGESYLDQSQEKTPKSRAKKEATTTSSFSSSSFFNFLNPKDGKTKKRASIPDKPSSNSKPQAKATSSLHLPRLVGNDLGGSDLAKTTNRSRVNERLPDVEDDDCPVCRSQREAIEPAKHNHSEKPPEAKNLNKSVAFTVQIAEKAEVPEPKQQVLKKVESSPAFQSNEVVKAKTPAPPKSGVRRFAAPSSLSVGSTSTTEIREPVEKATNANPETDEKEQVMKPAVSLEPVKEIVKSSISLPVIENNGANSIVATRQIETSFASQQSTPIRGTVLPPTNAVVKNISQPQQSIIIPPRLLAGLHPKVSAAPLDTDEAIRLKTLVFGSAYRKPTEAWRHQSLAFAPENGSSSSSAPRFVLIQRPNTGSGTTGVLAVVQAELLKQILYSSSNSNTIEHKQQTKPSDPFSTLRLLTRSQRSDFLCAALAEIIWRAATAPKSPFSKGSNAKNSSQPSSDQMHVAKVVIPCGRRVLPVDGAIADDGITEKLLVFTFPMSNEAALLKELRTFFRQNMVHFDSDGSGGVLLTLYSAVLSRGIDTIEADFDETVCSSLITPDAYTSTEAMNLMLVGVASSYLFNDDVYVASDSNMSSSSSSSSIVTSTSPQVPLEPSQQSNSAMSFDSGTASSAQEATVQTFRHLRGIPRRNDLGLLILSEFCATSSINATNPKPEQMEALQLAKKKKSAFKLSNSSDDDLKQLKDKMTKVGSYLKTPRFPVWVAAVSLNNTRYAVLYSTNIELISNWRAERLFDLFYLDAWMISIDKQKMEASVKVTNCLQPLRLRMDAIDRPDLAVTSFDLNGGDGDDDNEAPGDGLGSAPQKREPPAIEQVLQTKWPGAVVDYLPLPNSL